MIVCVSQTPLAHSDIIGTWTCLYSIHFQITVPGVDLIGSNVNCSTDAVSKDINSSEVCYEHLTEALQKQNCGLPKSGKLKVPNVEVVQQVLSGLELLNPSEECKKKVTPFLCLSLLGLCSESGVHIQPTNHQCVEIRDQVCRKVWAEAANFNIELPDCDTLPLSLPPCDPEEPDDNMNVSGMLVVIIYVLYSLDLVMETGLFCYLHLVLFHL